MSIRKLLLMAVIMLSTSTITMAGPFTWITMRADSYQPMVTEMSHKPFVHPEQGIVEKEEAIREVAPDLFRKPEAAETGALCPCK